MPKKYTIYDKKGEFLDSTNSEDFAKLQSKFYEGSYKTNMFAPRKKKVVNTFTGRDKINDLPNLHWGFSSEELHKGTDKVKAFGYKRDILFGEKGSRSTGHLKDF